jgi:hypothetical protein
MLGRLVRMSVLALIAAALACPCAFGDGDPASDFLVSEDVYLPVVPLGSKAAVSTGLADKLAEAVREAAREGDPIKVALIAGRYDLGSIPSLWRRPRAYARFLGAELAYVYRGTLLIAMPNGFGLYHDGHSVAGEQRLLRPIVLGSDPNGLIRAATVAVERLKAPHEPTSTPTVPGSAGADAMSRRDQQAASRGLSAPVLAVLAGAAAFVVMFVFVVWVRRRASGSSPG